MRSDRMILDDGTTIVLTKWNDGAISVDIIDDDGERAMQIRLTARDVDEVSAVIHRHDDGN